MTETQVDSLVLDISVKDSSGGKSSEQKLSAITRTLLKFESTVQKLDVKMFRNKFTSMAKAVKPFVTEINSAKSSILALDRLLSKKSLTGVTQAAAKIDTQTVDANTPNNTNSPKSMSGTAQPLEEANKGSLKSLASQYGELTKSVDNANGTRTLFYQQEKEGKTIISQVSVELDKNNKILEETAQLMKRTEKAHKSDILGSFKRVAMYRLVRSVLKEVTQAMSEGIQNVTKFDKESRKSMGTISSSFTVMKNSVGTIIMPVLKVAAPLINGIARGVGTLANAISYLTAKIQGQNKYMKVNLDYLEEYNKETKLLDFDNFSSLNKDQSRAFEMFDWVEMDDGALSGLFEDVKGIEALVWSIAGALTFMGVAKIIQWISGGGITNLIKGLTSVDNKMASIGYAAAGIGLVVESIFNIVNWDETTSGLQKTLDIITLICGVVAVICGLLAAFLPAGAAKIVKATAAVATFVGLASGVGSMVSQHADGGMFEGTGTIYHQVGESGAEVVATGTYGTGVLNVEQFQMAMLGALNDYGAARGDDMKLKGNVYLKEKEVGKIVEDSVYNEGVRVGHFK